MELLWAKNGDSAKNVIDGKSHIDLVLLDIILPGIDGVSLLKHTKKMRPDLPVISVTAYAMNDVRKKCLDAGTDGFITKPIRKREVMKAIRPFLSEPNRYGS